jgi:hypothetical protein
MRIKFEVYVCGLVKRQSVHLSLSLCTGSFLPSTTRVFAPDVHKRHGSKPVRSFISSSNVLRAPLIGNFAKFQT